jgi:hypothetical protein
MDAHLGRIILHDPKSRAFAYPKKTPVAGKSVRHRLLAPNVDQFYLGACVGFSGTNLLNTRPGVRSRKRFNTALKGLKVNKFLDNNDGIRNYSEATKRDPFEGEYPPTDDGSSALGLMKWWQDAGLIPGYDWCFTFDQFLAALQKQPVLLGTWWYEGLGEPDSRGRVHKTGDQIGGHEFLANAILWRDRLIGCENSWGEEWSERGKFYLTWDDAEALIMEDGDVAVPRLL